MESSSSIYYDGVLRRIDSSQIVLALYPERIGILPNPKTTRWSKKLLRAEVKATMSNARFRKSNTRAHKSHRLLHEQQQNMLEDLD